MSIITLVDKFVSEFLQAQESFLEDLGNFPVFEETIHNLSDQMVTEILGTVLTIADNLICDCSIRKGSYTVQRRWQRTLISSVGDVTFTHTLYKDKEGKIRCLLDEMIHLPDRERFTAVAEARVLNEAEVHSYQHAAESVKTNGQAITKASS